jgi:tRNA (adenine57-N1/adenine58-N1)-methyltransferase
MTTWMRSGPFVEGEWVRLSDAKGRKHNIRLEAGREFSTKKGQLRHDDIIGEPEGIIVTSTLEGQYQVFRPLLSEYVVSMPRGAAIIYPPRTSSRWPTSTPAHASSRQARARAA